MHQLSEKLHLGCGAIILPGWSNLDLAPGAGGLAVDLTKKFPYRDDSVAYIFSEHFLEHLSREQGLRFLRDCRRVMRQGAVLRIVTPDLQLMVQDYLDRNITRVIEVWRPLTPCAMLNEAMHLWGHQFLYDADEMRRVLFEAGFSYEDIRVQEYKQSEHAALVGIDQRPYHGELIFEATK